MLRQITKLDRDSQSSLCSSSGILQPDGGHSQVKTMQNLDFDAVKKLLNDWKTTGIDQALIVLATMAKFGMDQMLSQENQQSETPVAHDPALSPTAAASYCGISWKTLRDNWVTTYSIKSFGTGRSRRFRISELNRVLALREEQPNGEPV